MEIARKHNSVGVMAKRLDPDIAKDGGANSVKTRPLNRADVKNLYIGAGAERDGGVASSAGNYSTRLQPLAPTPRSAVGEKWT
jgi:hypothetical protein